VEARAVDPVHRVEVVFVDELDLGLHNAVQRRSRRFEDRLKVVDGLVELSFESALHEIAGLRITTDLRGDVNQATVLPRMHVWSARLGRLFRRDRAIWAHSMSSI